MENYRILRVAMSLLRVVGWLLVAAGLIGALAGVLFAPNTDGIAFRAPAFVAGLAVVLRGALVVVAAEVIRLLLDIRSRL